MNFDKDLLAKNIRHLMAEKGINSETELASKAGMNQPTVTRILNAPNEPRLSNVMKIASVLGVEYWQLLSTDLSSTSQQQTVAQDNTDRFQMSPEHIDLLREILIKVDRLILRDQRDIDTHQKAQIVAAALTAGISENLRPDDMTDSLLRTALNAAIQSK